MEYYAYGGGELIAALFNAVAAFMRSATFIDMAAVAALIGIVFGMIGALQQMNLQSPFRLALTAMVAYSALVVPRAEVVVVDRMADGSTPGGLHGPGTFVPVAVDNVPLMLALVGHASSLVGTTLADSFETLLGVPAERRIGAGGLFVVHRALRAMMNARPLRDKHLKADFVGYMQNCAFFDVEVDRRYSYADLLDGAPLDHLGNTGDRVTSVTLPDGQPLTTTCARAWAGGAGVHGSSGTTAGMRMRIEDEAAYQKALACLETGGYLLGLAPGQVQALARDLDDPDAGFFADCGTRHMDEALDFLGLAARPAGERIRENLAIELVRDYAYSVPDIDPVAVAAGKTAAERGRNSAYVIMGRLARETLPVIRSALEAVGLAMFPIVIALALAAPANMLQYIRLEFTFLLWIQLWPPLMAIVNELSHHSARAAMAKYVAIADGDLSYAVYDAALDEITLHQATSSYLLVLVPLLAYFLAKGTDFAGALLAGRFLQPSEGMAAGFARSAALSNWTSDQIETAPTTGIGAAQMQVRDAAGSVTTTTHSGRQYLELGSRMTASVQSAQTAVLASASANTLAVGESLRQSAAETMASAYTKGFTSLRTNLDSSSLDAAHQAKDLASERQGLAIVRRAHEELTRGHGVAEEESARALGTIAANAGLGVDVFGQKASLGASANVSKTVMERALVSVRRQLGESESESMEDVKAFATEYARSESFRSASSSSIAESSSVGEEFRRASQAASEANAYLSKSRELAEQARLSEENRFNTAVDLLRNQPHLGRMLDERVRAHLAQGGSMTEASEIVGRELERQGLFDVNIDGKSLTPAQIRGLADEAVGRVKAVGEDSLREPEMPPPSEVDGSELQDNVERRIEQRRSDTQVPEKSDGGREPTDGSESGQVIRVLERFGESVGKEFDAPAEKRK